MCSWCHRAEGTWEPGGGCVPYGRASGSVQFCSESCFAAGRRAAFKKARTCEWCKHVRPSMSFKDFQVRSIFFACTFLKLRKTRRFLTQNSVKFQDGEHQLQFCSQKCLNQYKMNIFCRETQAHLGLHGINNTISSTNLGTGNLITPEMWLQDCGSPSSPSEELIVDDDPNTRSSSIHEDDESCNRDEDSKKESESSETDKCIKDINSVRLRTIPNESKDEDEDTDVEVTEEETIRAIMKVSEKEDDCNRQGNQLLDQMIHRFPVQNLSKYRTSISPVIRDRTKEYVNSSILDSGSSHESELFSRDILHMKDVREVVPNRGRRSIRHG